ncbi:MAG: hypothetical protein ACJ74U_07745 [Jatrophihabitantaceae bacterium]
MPMLFALPLVVALEMLFILPLLLALPVVVALEMPFMLPLLLAVPVVVAPPVSTGPPGRPGSAGRRCRRVGWPGPPARFRWTTGHARRAPSPAAWSRPRSRCAGWRKWSRPAR